MIWAVLALVGLAALWLGWRLAQGVRRERERRLLRALRARERDEARRVLAEGAPPLEAPGLDLAPGEHAYHRASAWSLEPEPDGGFRRRERGELVVTDRALIFRTAAGRVERTPMPEVERVDIPFVDVIAFVTFADTIAREERRAHYQVERPLLLAAHVARFAGFELLLE